MKTKNIKIYATGQGSASAMTDTAFGSRQIAKLSNRGGTWSMAVPHGLEEQHTKYVVTHRNAGPSSVKTVHAPTIVIRNSDGKPKNYSHVIHNHQKLCEEIMAAQASVELNATIKGKSLCKESRRYKCVVQCSRCNHQSDIMFAGWSALTCQGCGCALNRKK